MADFKKTTAKTVGKHLRAFADWLDKKGSDADRHDAAVYLNEFLDDWLAMDAFGTEGHNDPRGDHRD